MAFGGRVAEEIIFGENKVTTGAAQDIQQATEMARRMVTQFGMSERVGLFAVGEREQAIFIGREIAQRHEVSAKLQELVDAEIKSFLDQAYGKAKRILMDNPDILHAMANALLERETLDREDVQLIVAGKELPPLPAEVIGSADTSPSLPGGEVKAPQPEPGSVLGAPPPKPAGA